MSKEKRMFLTLPSLKRLIDLNAINIGRLESFWSTWGPYLKVLLN